jgi:hypothetical protein
LAVPADHPGCEPHKSWIGTWPVYLAPARG